MTKSKSDGWTPLRTVTVRIARNGFTAFAARQGVGLALDKVRMFRVLTDQDCTIVQMMPYERDGVALVDVLEAAIEPGEAIVCGTQSYSVERARVLATPDEQ